MFHSQPCTFYIILNFDPGYSWLKVMEDNLSCHYSIQRHSIGQEKMNSAPKIEAFLNSDVQPLSNVHVLGGKIVFLQRWIESNFLYYKFNNFIADLKVAQNFESKLRKSLVKVQNYYKP